MKFEISPDIYNAPVIIDLENDIYHSAPGISRSGLFTIETKTPGHYRFGEREESSAFALGSMTHSAILEPNTVESHYLRGPDDRRGSKWVDAQAQAEEQHLKLVVGPDYDLALRIRDAVARDQPGIVRRLPGALIEKSAFAVDDETGRLVRVRPDAVLSEHGIMLDVKTTTNASNRDLERSVATFGYHFQAAMYQDVWHAAGGAKVDGFFLLSIEKTEPYYSRLIEISPKAVEEGRAMYREAIAKYHECMTAEEIMREESASDAAEGRPWSAEKSQKWLMQCWPGYDRGVSQIDLPRWGYRYTSPYSE